MIDGELTLGFRAAKIRCYMQWFI